MCLAIPGKIIEIEETEDLVFRTGKVSFDGITRSVNLSMVPDVVLNDFVLVHVGVALKKIDAAEAKRVLGYLKEIGGIEEEIGSTRYD